jgi:hypothetical protein
LKARKNTYSKWIKLFAVSIAFAGAMTTFAQQLKTEVDTTLIAIGEQIHYTLKTEIDTTSQIQFPKPIAFSPLEVVKSYPVDTLLKNNRWELEKRYTLTQFDSGSYQLPKLQVWIDSIAYETPSYDISVLDVEVDTTQQKLYGIKEIKEVEKTFEFPWGWSLALLILAAIGYGAYLYFNKGIEKFKKEEEAFIPAYDKALNELKRLEQSKYLIKEEYKKYYTELTNIVRSYLEEEVHVSALESTTDQLIEKLQLLKESGGLAIDQETITQFNAILQTADLVKFARSKPDILVAENDREKLKQIVVKTKEAIPEPTQEELMQQEAYKKALLEAEKKRKRKHIAMAISTILLLGIVSTVLWIGPQKSWDTLTRNPSKLLLESNWITSQYGIPPVTVSTPKVLLRNTETPSNSQEGKSIQFGFEDDKQLLRIQLETLRLNQEKEPDFDALAESLMKQIENRGGKNIITKQEPYTTKDQIQGVKVFGHYTQEVQGEMMKKEYELFVFGGKGFAQTLFLSWKEEDAYLKTISNRIVESIRLKEEENVQ